MELLNNRSLKPFNTFSIDVKAKYLVELNTIEEVKKFMQSDVLKNEKHLLLGGGSNVLFTKDFEGVVILVNLKGIQVVEENEDCVYVKAEAGENWDDFVSFCVENGYGGLENLSLIPGNVGSSPIQNIGAYGVELKDVFYKAEALNKKTNELEIFTKKDCGFGYRNSVFKNEAKGKYIITAVTFQLSKKPQVKVEYGAIRETLLKRNIANLTIVDVRKAICDIRDSKLPDYKNLGNAGSFFKNPIVSFSEFERVKGEFPDLVSYQLMDGNVKLAAAWLIEQSGWKGYRIGDAAVHEKQALVLVNHGHATGKEILELSEKIIDSVEKKFGITLHREVNVI